MKKVNLLVILVVVMGLIITGCGNTAKNISGEVNEGELVDTWEEIEGKGKIIMGLDDTFVPMGFRDSSGELTGFDVDLARAVFEEIGIELEFQPIDWNIKEQELNSGNIDLIWNGYTITPGRIEKVNFTKPYLDNRQVIVTLSETDISKKSDLAGRVVATQNSSSSLDAMEKEDAIKDFKNAEAILFDTYNEAFMDLEAKRAEAVVADEVLARYYISERGPEKFKVLEEDFGDEEYGVGVRKGDKILLDKLNKAFEDIKSNGIGEEISKKWFGENIIK